MHPADDAVKEEVVAESTQAESAPVENKTDDGAKAQVAEAQVQKDDGELIPQETDSQGPDADDTAGQAEAEETDTQPQGEEQLAPKSQNRFQKLANDNREKEEIIRRQNEELARLKAQENQFATEQELLNEVNPETGDYYTPAEVERIAFAKSRETQAQSIAQQRYELEVRQNQQTLASEAEKALEDFPIFDEQSKDYNSQLAAQADELLKNSLIIQDGTVVGSTLSPYQIYKTIADATKANAPVYQAQAQRATEKMLANADVPSGNQQGEPAFNKLSPKEMEAKLRAKGYDI